MAKKNKALKKFLKERGALTRFRKNCIKVEQIGTTEGNMMGFFVWKGTPEGHKYWSDLHEEFNGELRVQSSTRKRLNLWR